MSNGARPQDAGQRVSNNRHRMMTRQAEVEEAIVMRSHRAWAVGLGSFSLCELYNLSMSTVADTCFYSLLLAFGGYFALGAYYNYSTYGARGVDLIP
jgi:hypothetical protein